MSSLDATAAAAAEFIDRAMSAARASTVECLGTVDLTVSQVRMLFLLLKVAAPIPVHEVADGVGLSLAAAGRAADRLVAAGLVDRREDERDRRVKRLSLTEAGHEFLATNFRLHAADLRGVLAGLPADALDRLRTALVEAAEHLPPSPVRCTGAPAQP